MTHAVPRTLQKQKGMNGTLLSFLLAAAGALAIFLPFLLVDNGFFLYCGDYNSQQIPFYMYVQQFIKDGGGTWSWATDIGSSAVNSYSFYNMGSPFMWLSMVFPSRWLPFLMVPLFMVKFGAIAAAANLFFKRYAKTRNMAVICSVLYAFCGFNVYNTFFNHMLDPVALFPLLLWAMDGFVYDKKRGVFALVVGLALLNSYFFFIGNVVFLLIYFCVKVYTREYRIKAGEFGLLAFEAVVGVGIGLVLALPAFLNLIGNPRTTDFASGFNMVMFWEVQQYFAIFSSLFLPPDPPYMPNLFTEGAIKWTSMSAFLPIVSVAGVAAYLKSRKKTATKWMLGIFLLMAMVPFLNSSFYAFNISYYARWYYMPILLMCFATLRSLEEEDIDLRFGAKVALVGTALYAIFGLLPNQKDGVWTLGVAQANSKFWLTWLTAMLGVGIFYALVRYGKKKVRFAPLLLSAIMAFSVFYSVIHISLGKFPWYEADSHLRSEMYDAVNVVDLPDENFYRIDTFGSYDNLGLWLDKSCLQTFNSVVTPSIMEFYPMVGVKRDVSSKPEAEHYALRGLLSVRYTLIPSRRMEVPVEMINATRQQLGVADDLYAMPYNDIPAEYLPDKSQMQIDWCMDVNWGTAGSYGWNFYAEQGPYVVFENQNYVPLGYTYDTYLDMDNLWYAAESDRAPLLMRSVGLTAEQIETYGHLFTGEDGERSTYDSEGGGQQLWYSYNPVGYNEYVLDTQRARENASYAASYDSSGFTVNIQMDRENLVFFGVPYDPGFTATVNGQAAEVLKVSGGMMAVAAPAGDNEIVFTYKTPGMALGTSFTLLSLAVLVLYVLLTIRWRRSDKYKQKQEALARQRAAALARKAAGRRAAPAPYTPPVGALPPALAEPAEQAPAEAEPPGGQELPAEGSATPGGPAAEEAAGQPTPGEEENAQST